MIRINPNFNNNNPTVKTGSYKGTADMNTVFAAKDTLPTASADTKGLVVEKEKTHSASVRRL